MRCYGAPMHATMLSHTTVIAWIMVAIGALVLAVVVLRYPASNRTVRHPSSIVVGVAFMLCGLAAAGYAISLL